MKRQLNIVGSTYKYKYLIEYNKSYIKTDTHDIHWYNDNKDIRLLLDDTVYYRKQNDWYNTDTIKDYKNDSHLPSTAYKTNIKFYIPNFAAHIHTNGVKYMISCNTWINGVRVDLGSFLFRPTDAKAIETGPVKCGNNEYFEYVSFDIIDPFYLMYGDDWEEFRSKVCLEPKNINSTTAALYVTLYIVSDYENRYMLNHEFTGSCSSFIVAEQTDSLSVKIGTILQPNAGIRFTVNMNSEYNWLLTYIRETYNLNVTADDIKFNIAIKNEDNIVPGPIFSLNTTDYGYGYCNQDLYWKDINDSFKLFFSSWNDFEEGWYFVASMTIYKNFENDIASEDEEIEAHVFMTNSIPITQEIYSIFTNGASEKIDISSLVVPKYNIVNKLTHDITQIDRPSYTLSSNDYIEDLPVRIKRPSKFNIHKTYVKPLIKLNNNDRF